MRAFFIECAAPFWVRVARILQEQVGLEPVYWTALPAYEDDLRKTFPKMVYQDCTEAKFGTPAIDPSTFSPVSLGGAVRDVWVDDAQIFYDMLSRFDMNLEFSFRERRRYFRRVLTYWSGVIDRLRPDLVVFPCAPHVAYDYVIYALCKRLGIRTVLFEWAPIGRPAYVLTVEDFREMDLRLRDTYRALVESDPLPEPRLSDRALAYLTSQRADYQEARPAYMRRWAEEAEYRKSDEFKENLRKGLHLIFAREAQVPMGFRPPSMSWMQKLWDQLVERLDGVSPPSPRKERRRAWLTSCWKQMGVRFADAYDKTEFGETELQMCHRWWWAEGEHRIQMYERIARPPDLDVPFVYVSLQLEPERTANPQGGLFADQVWMVRTLSESVPQGWRIYVKEHPNQLNPMMLGHIGRDPGFYDEIASFPGVSFVPLSIVPFDLVDRARAVATITGTVGWESVIRGVPALLFGAAWYQDCEGVFRTATVDDCARVFEKCSSGYQVDARKVGLFIEAVERTCFEGWTDCALPNQELTDEENARRIAGAIHKILDPAGTVAAGGKGA